MTTITIHWKEYPLQLLKFLNNLFISGCAASLFLCRLFSCCSEWAGIRRWHPTPVLLPGKSMDGGAWWAAVHGVTKSRTRLSEFTFTFFFHALEKEMATHSSVLAWRIPGTGEPGGLPSVGSHRVGHDWSDLAAAAAAAEHRIRRPHNIDLWRPRSLSHVTVPSTPQNGTLIWMKALNDCVRQGRRIWLVSYFAFLHES